MRNFRIEVENCRKKIRFDKRRDAKDHTQKVRRAQGLDLVVYSCLHCGGFHLTKRKNR